MNIFWRRKNAGGAVSDGHTSRRRFRPRVDLMEERTLLSLLTVTNTKDSGPGSLRDTISSAAAGDVIQFQFLRGSGNKIALTSGALSITKPLTIVGPSQSTLTVDAGYKSQVFLVNTSGDVEIRNLTISGGRETLGGGISAKNAHLVLKSDLVKDNLASPFIPGTTGLEAFGGGVAIVGDGARLDVTDTVFSGNTTQGAAGNQIGLDGSDAFGGAIYAGRGTSVFVHGGSFMKNSANGGAGKAGAAGNAGAGTDGGRGGNGGKAVGGAIAALGSLEVSTAMFSDNAALAGAGGKGGSGLNGGVGGNGGAAHGGAIYAGAGLKLSSATLIASAAQGGAGGNGGNGALSGPGTLRAGNGGQGGEAVGGGVEAGGVGLRTVGS
ncbi:MAG: hypothetical protein U0835_23985, partial [Isosphaeraceae bacterium]